MQLVQNQWLLAPYVHLFQAQHLGGQCLAAVPTYLLHLKTAVHSP